MSAGLTSWKEVLWLARDHLERLVDEQRGREIVELVEDDNIRPSVADRRIGQLILHPRPFAEGSARRTPCRACDGRDAHPPGAVLPDESGAGR